MPSKSTWHSVPSTSLDSVRRLDLFKQFMPNRTMRFWGLDVFFMCMKIYSVSANTLIIYQLKVLCELSCWYIYVSVVGVEICGTQLGGMEVIQVLRYFHWWWGDIGELAMDVQADADKRTAHASRFMQMNSSNRCPLNLCCLIFYWFLMLFFLFYWLLLFISHNSMEARYFSGKFKRVWVFNVLVLGISMNCLLI